MQSKLYIRFLYLISQIALAFYVVSFLAIAVWYAPTLLGMQGSAPWEPPGISVPVDVSVHKPSWRVDPMAHDGSPAALTDLKGELLIHPNSPETFLRLMLPALLTMIIGFVILWTLRNILRDVRHGDPFNLANVRRIATLAMMVLANELAGFFNPLLLDSLMRDSLVAPGLTLGFKGEIHGSAGLFAFLLLTLAEVFHHGLRLEQDQTLTV